ncbi:aminotransferase class V-fold PLP-dependent enzyme [Nocardia takedensis]|uniref:aminotransferase class V-fold PLP-dependent enzyme n=1 Tax=Nocardia takedensis TaxID=259390 RepID=UPI0002D695A7|nr:aminotransferase class V-fold PLP-dependent enzyme [Nocardia takedensis]
MNPHAYEDFLLDPDLVQLNHASYGVTSRRVATEAETVRRHIESDPTRFLGTELRDKLRFSVAEVATFLGLDLQQIALCSNATSGATAIIASLPLRPTDTVVVLDTEYSSVVEVWRVACARVGACLHVVEVPLPFPGVEELLGELDARITTDIRYLQMSLVSSSAALRIPVDPISAWARTRGGQVVLDAAHGPGHLDMAPALAGVVAAFGTLHKWLPTARPIGFLWLAPELIELVRPPEVSLTWHCQGLVERFSWPGTFDPAPRLCVAAAIEQWSRWHDNGRWDFCLSLADEFTSALVELDLRPVAESEYRAPRMRSFLFDRATVADVKSILGPAGIRVWVGTAPSGRTLLRISTHTYNDHNDIDRLMDRLAEVPSR